MAFDVRGLTGFVTLTVTVCGALFCNGMLAQDAPESAIPSDACNLMPIAGKDVRLVPKVISFRISGINESALAAIRNAKHYICSLPDCFSRPCMNGASCYETDMSYGCQCVEGFRGPLCEEDIEPPKVTCPANITANTDHSLPTATVVYGRPSMQDNSGGPVNLVYSRRSGSSFLYYPDGHEDRVTCDATDQAGNVGHCEFFIKVVDGEPPNVTCPANITATTEHSLPTATVIYGQHSVEDNSGGPVTVVFSPLSGSAFSYHPDFPKTKVACNATDQAGNVAYCEFFVEVVDKEQPNITCRSDMVVGTTGESAVVDFMAGTEEFVITDNSGFPVEGPNCTWPGSNEDLTFYRGITNVDCNATDRSGNIGSCTFSVTVLGPPRMECQDLIKSTDPGVNTVSMNISAEWGQSINAYDDLNRSLAVQECSEEDGFVLTWNPDLTHSGTLIICTSEPDQLGQQAKCSFHIRVVDQEEPMITCHADVVDGSLEETAVVMYRSEQFLAEFNLTDNCGPPIEGPTCSRPPPEPADDYVFYKGVTDILCNATDRSGNIANCTFAIRVIGLPFMTCPDQTRTTHPGQNTASLVISPEWNESIAAFNGLGEPLAIQQCSEEDDFVLTWSPDASNLGTPITCTSDPDQAGTQADCTFYVQVVDEEPPQVHCNSSGFIEVTEDAFVTIARNNFTRLTSALDNSGLEPTVACSTPEANDTDETFRFYKGVTMVICEATDISENAASCSHNVIIYDVPRINCPTSSVWQPLTKDTEPGEGFADLQNFVETYNVNATGGDSEELAIEGCMIGNITIHELAYQRNPYSVTCKTVADITGRSAECTIYVKITDPEPPQPTCFERVLGYLGPNDMSYDHLFRDNVMDPLPTVSCNYIDPASDSLDRLSCTITDDAGNTAECEHIHETFDLENDC